MSRALITESTLTGIANAIRTQLGTDDTYTPAEMPAAIQSIHGGTPELQEKTATQNGTVTPDSGYDGLSRVNVNVPNTYGAGDEGKVVSNGTLVSQTSKGINANGTVDTTTNNQVVVSVPNSYGASDEGKVVSGGALVAQTSATKTANGTYDTTTNNQVVVSVDNSYTAADEGKVVNNGALIEQTSKNVNANGTVDTTTNNAVVVNVPNSYSQSDEGKVVSSGALVSQTATTKTANGTYDTTENNQVTVDVANSYTASDEGKVVDDGALVAQTSRTVRENGTYDTTTNDEVVVDVMTAQTPVVWVKKGDTANLVALYGYYGPLGDVDEDYLVPVDAQTKQEIKINPLQPYEIKFSYWIDETFDTSFTGTIDPFGPPIRLDLPEITFMRRWVGTLQDGSYVLTFRLSVAKEIDNILTSEDVYVDVPALNVSKPTVITLTRTVDTLTMTVETGYPWVRSVSINNYTSPTYYFQTDSTIELGGVWWKNPYYDRYSDLISYATAKINLDECYIRQGDTVLWAPEPSILLQSKTVTNNGVVTADAGYDGLSDVTVNVEGGSTLTTKNITQNGSYSASSDSADGYSAVTVNVPNSYAASDEGKVVQNGALVGQTSRTVTANGTVDTTTNDEVVVNVPSSQPNLQSKTVTENGTVVPDTGYDGLSSVVVNVPGGGGGTSLQFHYGRLTINSGEITESDEYCYSDLIPISTGNGRWFLDLARSDTSSFYIGICGYAEDGETQNAYIRQYDNYRSYSSSGMTDCKYFRIANRVSNLSFANLAFLVDGIFVIPQVSSVYKTNVN